MHINFSIGWYALRLSIVAGISYLMGFLISDWTLAVLQPIGGLWSAISGVLVLKQGKIETFHTGLNRIVGTLIGCLIGALYLSITNMIWFFPLAILVTAIICLSYPYLKNTNVSACLACCVVIIIWQVGFKNNVWLFSFSRFAESLFGVIVAFAIFRIRLPKKQ